MNESMDMTQPQHESPTPTPRIIREPLGGCRRTAMLLGVILLGVVLVGTGLWLTASDADGAAVAPAPIATGMPAITVYSDPSCKCCLRWIRHLQDAGFHVQHVSDPEMARRKDALGIPSNKRSCHTAVIGGYVVEGHVPAADIVRMVKSRQSIKGLVLPGMPSGAPGMEPAFGSGEAYTVEALRADGSSAAFSAHPAGR